MSTKPRILVVDDDEGHRLALEALLARWGYAVTPAGDGREAVRAVGAGEDAAPSFAAVLMDIRMAGMDGLTALRHIREQAPGLPVILMTAYASLDTAIEALRAGASDYCLKPLDFDLLRALLARCASPDSSGVRVRPGDGPGQGTGQRAGQGADQGSVLDGAVAGEQGAMQAPFGLVGQSRPMRELVDLLVRVAESEATVLISGPSGTGKELVARAIHTQSARAAGPWVAVNCAALSENLLESELFGHEKGAFTGADRRRDGRFLQAGGGTLFLDEIGEMPLAMQAKLLRAIQQREIQRVGGDATLSVDVRLVAATNRDLAEEVRAGRFREDLYYRLNVVTLQVPALRERREDILPLARHFLAAHAARNRKTVRAISPEALDRLLAYDWPGNVRELENTMERAVVLLVGDTVTERELPLSLRTPAKAPDRGTAPDRDAGSPPAEAVPALATLEDLERDAILRTLAAVGDNKTEAARRLGISRKTLHLKLRRYALEQDNPDQEFGDD